MDKQKKQSGGAGRGQGRKPISPGAPLVRAEIKLTGPQKEKLRRLGGAPLVRAEIKLTGPQKEKLRRLGGAPWVRNKIDQELEPE